MSTKAAKSYLRDLMSSVCTWLSSKLEVETHQTRHPFQNDHNAAGLQSRYFRVASVPAAPYKISRPPSLLLLLTMGPSCRRTTLRGRFCGSTID